MTRAVRELAQIPFGTLIGQPMKAAVEAQALAAKTTVEFIEKVGFVPPSNNPIDALFQDEQNDADVGRIRNVTFKYTKNDENDGDQEHSLSVPILAIVPIPTLRIDEMTIDFTAKLTDTIASNRSSNFTLNSSVSGKYKAFWSPISMEFRTSVAASSSASQASRYNREYTMAIHVRAVQDDIPPGLGRVLDILEQLIKERPAAPAPTPP